MINAWKKHKGWKHLEFFHGNKTDTWSLFAQVETSAGFVGVPCRLEDVNQLSFVFFNKTHANFFYRAWRFLTHFVKSPIDVVLQRKEKYNQTPHPIL